MWLILGLFLAGMSAGIWIKSAGFRRPLAVAIDILIYLLLFLMGADLAATPGFAENFRSMGFHALVISVSSILGSIGAVLLLERFAAARKAG